MQSRRSTMDSPWYGVGARELSNVRVSGGFAAILCAGVQLQVLIRLAAVHAIKHSLNVLVPYWLA